MANSNGWGDGAANNAIGWGQGANNTIGWGSSHATSWAGATDIVGLATDADAQAFITAAAITDATQITAINNLVVGMKADGIWTKMKAIYPFVGGTASTHKWNLKDPRDLDAAFRLVFNGGWTHSSNGATPNGTNGYADTKISPSSVFSSNDNISLGYYTRDVSTIGLALVAEMGSANLDYSNGVYIVGRYNGDSKNYTRISSSATNSFVVSATAGLYYASRIASNQYKILRNGNILSTPAIASSGRTSNNMWIGGINYGIAAEYGIGQCAFSYVSDGLTDTEASNLYSRVQTYQNSLNRAV